MSNVFSNLYALPSRIAAVSAPENIKTSGVLPAGQQSIDDQQDELALIEKGLAFLKPGYQFEVVPIIRKLKDANPDVAQAFRDVIQLANTGFELKFDPGVKPDQQKKMREALDAASLNWAPGSAGIHGIANRVFSQILTAGGTAVEWVPNARLTGLERVKFLVPENIRFLKTANGDYRPYQKVRHKLLTPTSPNLFKGEYVELNTNTFKYFAHLGDAEVPYGTPPYLPSLGPLGVQKRMSENIDHIISTMGILGWVEALMQKPEMRAGESETQYTARLEDILKKLRERVKGQLRDGIAAGFIDDHEFEFKQTVTSAEGVGELWGQNEQQIASALGFDPAFMGRSYNSSETMITILFTKMLSQLTNLQNVAEYQLSYGIALFLRLAGFKFKTLKAEFNESTITDELKYQQAKEIKSRVALQNYLMGTIGAYQYAREMGYDAPFKKTPIIDPAIIAGKSNDQKDKVDKEKRDDKSAQKTRDKAKSQGTRRTKPRTS